MPSFPLHPRLQNLSPRAYGAIDTACTRQLELIEDRLRYDPNPTLEECRSALEDWMPDECLVLDLDLDEQLAVVEEYASDYGFDLAGVSFADLRGRIEGMSALVLGYLGQERAQAVFQEVYDLLEDLDLTINALLPDNPYSCFPHQAERDESPWQIYEYRGIEGELDVDLYELAVARVKLHVCHRIASTRLAMD